MIHLITLAWTHMLVSRGNAYIPSHGYKNVPIFPPKTYTFFALTIKSR